MGLFGSFFGEKRETKQTITTALDLVAFAASLASNQGDIDVTLDKVRSVTARLEPTVPIPVGDEMVLIRVYLQLEEYLVAREPIRTFTKAGLRERIAPELLAKVAAQESDTAIKEKA